MDSSKPALSVFVDPKLEELCRRMGRADRAGAAVRLLEADYLIEQHVRGEPLVRRSRVVREASLLSK